MKRIVIQVISLFLFINIYPQQNNPYQKGVTAERNLSTAVSVSPYSPGGVGFDNRYEGVKGSPRLYDTLQPALLWIKKDTNYFLINADLDVFQNRLVFRHPKTKSLMSVPSEIIREVIFTVNGKEQKYRTIFGDKFDSDVKKDRFCQILNEKQQFIRIPAKLYNEADYKNLYGPDRRYDEFELKYQYFYMTNDSVFHKVQPNQKTLIKLFPENKSLIESFLKGKKFRNNDDMMAKVLEKISESSDKK
jgi:hypothetical protein